MLSDEQRELRNTIRAWAEADVAPSAAQVDRNATFPREAWESYVRNGWVRMQYPTEYGGDGADHVSIAILVEEIARVSASASLTATISHVAMTPLLDFANEDLKAAYVPRVASGEVQASYCLSEVEAGSDVAAIACRAVRDGDTYVLSGAKYWITNAGVSDLYVVFAKTAPEAGAHGVTCFLIEADWGVGVTKFEDKMGMRASPTGEIVLDDVRVPATHRIGAEGAGFQIAMRTLDQSRPMIGAQAVGIAQGALDYAVGYMHERRAFGRELCDFQGLQFMVADAATRIEAARQLVYNACRCMDAGDPYGELTMVGSMAKLFASDVAMAVTTDAVQLLGGAGYTKEHPVERMMRDAKVTQIYEGTNQIQRIVIARRVLGALGR